MASEAVGSTSDGAGSSASRTLSRHSPGTSGGRSVERAAPPRAAGEASALREAAPANSVATSERPRFADELRAFDAAHAAFTRGDLSSAEAALGEYERDFSRGALALEAEVLRIELLHARGNTQALRGHARSFLAAHPTAPAARHVRKLLEQSEGTSP